MHRGWIAFMCLAAALLSFALASGGFYMATRWSEAVVITDVRGAATVTTRDHSRWLEVNYHIDFVRECPSQTQHIIYRDVTVLGRTQRVVIPLMLTLNGLGEPRDVVDFNIPFLLPDSIMPGDWFYIARTFNSCEYLPGLVRQQMQETLPIKVYIPPVK